MENTYQEFFDLIEKSDSIVIFGHAFPDGDCYGSSEGLKAALQEFYPQKKVYVSMTDWRIEGDNMPYADAVSDEVIAASLHIVCDLSDKKRIGDPRAFSLPNAGMIKVDHHYFTESFGGLEYVDTERASCSDYLAEILYSKFDHLPKLAAQMFFLGITTDSGRFQYSCSQKLLLLASRLIGDGAEPSLIFPLTTKVSDNYLRYKGYLMENFSSTRLGVCYCKVPYEVAQRYGLDGHSAALGVNAISEINSSDLWVVFGEDRDKKVYCEFRSKGNIDVHDIAVRFGGGGHLNASGTKIDSMASADEVLAACEETVLASFGTYSRELKTLLDLAESSMKIVMDFYAKGFRIDIKDDNSPVTSADKASDLNIREGLLKEYPDYGLLTEEDADDKKRLQKDKVFIIDPLDGTTDFVAKDNMFCINLALADQHVPVVGVVAVPYTGSIYFAVKDHGSYLLEKGHVIRRLRVSHKFNKITVLSSHTHKDARLENELKKLQDKGLIVEKSIGSAIKACMVAQGSAEACYTLGHGTKEWDTCAPQIVVTEAGGLYTDNHHRPIVYNREDVYNRDGFTILANKENDIVDVVKLIENE